MVHQPIHRLWNKQHKDIFSGQFPWPCPGHGTGANLEEKRHKSGGPNADKGAAGIDEQTLEEIEAIGVDNFLKGIQQELKARTYRPHPARRVYIPKSDGGKRPLSIPTIKGSSSPISAQAALEIQDANDHTREINNSLNTYDTYKN